ncbi:MAG TPA: transglycosylase domain-containing protein, partial [Micavibrio sp.]
MKMRYLLGGGGLLLVVLGAATLLSVNPITLSLPTGASIQVLDRHGVPLTLSYHESWNSTHQVPLHQVPPFMRDAFIQSEDRRFFAHSGVDWRARFSALWQNIRTRQAVRGASTITEQ